MAATWPKRKGVRRLHPPGFSQATELQGVPVHVYIRRRQKVEEAACWSSRLGLKKEVEEEPMLQFQAPGPPAEEFLLTWERSAPQSSNLLFGSSPDWTRPAHIREGGHPLYPKSCGLNGNLIQKYPPIHNKV